MKKQNRKKAERTVLGSVLVSVIDMWLFSYGIAHTDCVNSVGMCTPRTISSTTNHVKSTESPPADNSTQVGKVVGIGKYSCLFFPFP